MTAKDDRQDDAKRYGSNLAAMAAAIGMKPEDFFDAVKRQVTAKDVTAADFVALLHTAKQFGLDPLRKEVSLIQTKNGPRVYVTFDGWMRVLVSHPLYYRHGWKDEAWSGGARGKGTLDSVGFWIEKWEPIHAKHQPGPCKCQRDVFEHVELLRECKQDGEFTPWNKWPSRMLKEKAAMQGTRFCFAMYVPDLDDVVQADQLERADAATAGEDATDAPDVARGPIAPTAPLPPAALPEPREPLDFSRSMPRPEVAASDRVDEPTPSVATNAAQVLVEPVAPKSTPASLPAYSPEESARVAREDAEREAAQRRDDFDDIDLG